MAINKSIFDVQIAGMPFKLKTEHKDIFVNELVNFVNEHIEKCMSDSKNTSFQAVTILAALNIAEEHLILKKKALKSLTELEKKANKISSNLKVFSQ